VKGFLFDENTPSRLTFTPGLPVRHANELGKSPSDTEMWNFARQERLVIVSKDADFSNRIMLSSPPPWIVRLRFGNMRKREFHSYLKKIWPSVETLLPAHKLINVFQDRIEGIQE